MRMILYRTFLLSLFALVLAGIARAIPVPPKDAPAKPLQTKAAVEAMLRSAKIEAPLQHQGLAVFPVTLQATRDFAGLLTLDEAVAKKTLAISEVGDGDVNRAIAKNTGGQRIFLMAGEVIGGAKQDRMVAEDTLLSPRSSTEIAVWCVEENRWTTGGKAFRSERYMAPARVRQSGAHTTQSEVWGAVSGMQMRAKARRGSISSVARSEEVRKKMAPYQKSLLPLPKMRSDACGVVVAYGREWVAADIFSDPSLFRRLWPKILDSYLMDVVNRSPSAGKAGISDAENFLGQLFWAKQTAAQTAGEGKRIKLRGDKIYGSFLVVDTSVVHLEAFPEMNIPLERPIPSRRIMPHRR